MRHGWKVIQVGRDTVTFAREGSRSGAPQYSRRSRRGRIEHRDQRRQRVEQLISEFPELLDQFDSSLPFDRVGQYRHHRDTIDRRYALGSVAAAVADDGFCEMLYRTLRAWGIGKRASRLVDLGAFKRELRAHSSAVADLEGLSINDPSVDPQESGSLIWALIDGIALVENDARLVALSKALHHLLPELVPPIDRMYTQEFFQVNVADFQYRQRQVFDRMWDSLVVIARATNPAQYVGSGWRTSRTKVIDNAIVAFVDRERSR